MFYNKGSSVANWMGPPALPAPDFPKYLDELSLRMLHLETLAAAELREDLRRMETLRSLFSSYQQDAHRLRMELLDARRELKQAEQAFARVIAVWQRTARGGDLQRLQDRVDAWPLEFFLTEKERRREKTRLEKVRIS